MAEQRWNNLTERVMHLWGLCENEHNRLSQIAYRRIKNHFGYHIQEGVKAAMRGRHLTKLKTNLRNNTLVCIGTFCRSQKPYVFSLPARKLARLRRKAIGLGRPLE
jgi:hypothetical protein